MPNRRASGGAGSTGAYSTPVWRDTRARNHPTAGARRAFAPPTVSTTKFALIANFPGVACTLTGSGMRTGSAAKRAGIAPPASMKSIVVTRMVTRIVTRMILVLLGQLRRTVRGPVPPSAIAKTTDSHRGKLPGGSGGRRWEYTAL